MTLLNQVSLNPECRLLRPGLTMIMEQCRHINIVSRFFSCHKTGFLGSSAQNAQRVGKFVRLTQKVDGKGLSGPKLSL
ncbi:hypothetical protein [Hydrogenovibrio halophilus]|uniref:hypothetical protein n=1 Tax=Hydrogenovibrio halophilus TaxID=373391 RepID=UPI0012FE243D|nr:hypothetical protein [Hydrogenovibrio halophilus]